MFLINSYDTPLAQRASYLVLHSSLFEPDGSVNYDYIVTNSINSLLIGSTCIPNGAHTNLAHAQNVSKTQTNPNNEHRQSKIIINTII